MEQDKDQKDMRESKRPEKPNNGIWKKQRKQCKKRRQEGRTLTKAQRRNEIRGRKQQAKGKHEGKREVYIRSRKQQVTRENERQYRAKQEKE